MYIVYLATSSGVGVRFWAPESGFSRARVSRARNKDSASVISQTEASPPYYSHPLDQVILK